MSMKEEMNVSVTITIQHDEGKFKRNYRISRVADAADVGQSKYDARHTYQIEQTGGSKHASATFEHRYGDPLAALLQGGLAALSYSPDADSAVFESPSFARAL